jgi:hypothetical protein
MHEPPSEIGEEPFDSNEPPKKHSEDALWSAPQFGLNSIFFFMVPCAIVFAAVRIKGAAAVLPSITILLFFWLILGCVRLIRLAKRPVEDDDRPTH